MAEQPADNTEHPHSAEPVSAPPPVAERRWRAMGTDVHVIVVGGSDPDALVGRAVARIEELESRWSRFRPESEVSALNAAAGQWVTVSGDTVRLVERAIEAWRLTGGAVDATVLGAVIDAGYDRSFDDIAGTDRPSVPSRALLLACTDIEIDRPAGAVRLPEGTGFDPGGIGKGLAADVVTAEMSEAGASGVCVNMGGDLRVWGEGPDGEAWTIEVEHPWLQEAMMLVGLAHGAIATSTTLRRTWRMDGERRHHLIDPATGEPSDTDLNQATVIAPEAWMAEVLAKAVLLRGSERAFDLIDTGMAQALAVGDDGRVYSTDGFALFCGDVAIPTTIATPWR
jgi:thiamine biosynthesis lipoprotein